MVRYWVLFLYSQGKDVHCHHFYNAVKGRPAQEDKNKKSAAYGALGHPEGWVGRVLGGGSRCRAHVLTTIYSYEALSLWSLYYKSV